MFETKVYKECYPFSKEVLYDKEKRTMFLKLLRRRKIDLWLYRIAIRKQNKKIRKNVIDWEEEFQLITEIEKAIHDEGNYQLVMPAYPNWLLKKYRLVSSEILITIFPIFFCCPCYVKTQNLLF